MSKRPTAEPLRELQLQAGSNGKLGGALDVSGPATEDGKLLFRLTALKSEEDLYIDSSSKEHAFIAPALTWRPNDNTSLTLLAYFQKDKRKGTTEDFYKKAYLAGNSFYGSGLSSCHQCLRQAVCCDQPGLLGLLRLRRYRPQGHADRHPPLVMLAGTELTSQIKKEPSTAN